MFCELASFTAFERKGTPVTMGKKDLAFQQSPAFAEQKGFNIDCQSLLHDLHFPVDSCLDQEAFSEPMPLATTPSHEASCPVPEISPADGSVTGSRPGPRLSRAGSTHLGPIRSRSVSEVTTKG